MSKTPAPQLKWNGSKSADWTIALAHGAGAAMDTPFMEYFAKGLAQLGYLVCRFEFPYMAQRREPDSKRRPPDRESVLLDTWRTVLARLQDRQLVIGGKSMGGRMASLIADEMQVAGLVCLGYPFHPSGKPEKLRIEHLRSIRTPTLIVQGERDALGNREEVERYPLDESIRLHWLPDGDHSFKPRKSSGYTEEQNWQAGVERIGEFLAEISAR